MSSASSTDFGHSGHTPLQTAAPAQTPVVRTFGRFQLKQLIGRSSLTMAWLAHDPRSRLDVMLIMPRKAPATREVFEGWWESARRAAKLAHPHLLAPMEVGHHDYYPFQAFERLQGTSTLSELLAGKAPPQPMDVTSWCADLLEGLAFAHDAGVAHGDLGMHTVVIDKHGRAAAWGLSTALMPGAASGHSLNPESLRLQRLAGDRDTMATGLLLHWLLANQPALDETDFPTAIERLNQEIIRLPWSLPQPVPEALRAIVNRSTDRFEKRRYLSARSFYRAVSGWRKVQSEETGGALGLLVDRLHSVGHLPARNGLAQRVVQVARMETQRIDDLADIILQDPALSFELLRMVNSAHYGAQRETAVTTVRRAVQLVGVTGVRRAASSLRAWPGPLNEEAARALEAGLRQARLAGHLAETLVPPGLDAESALLAAQLQHLGRLLALYHFPDEAQQIQMLMQPQPPAKDGEPITPGLTEEGAANAVLGVDLQSLAKAVAKHWGLDESMQELLEPLPRDRTVRSPDSVSGWLRLVASCANELLDAARQPAQLQGKALVQVSTRYTRTLDYSPEALKEAMQTARQRLQAASGGGAPKAAA
jgi:HD-like signal output (HDOD) protein